MFRKLFPVLLICVTIAGGFAAGQKLRPVADEPEKDNAAAGGGSEAALSGDLQELAGEAGALKAVNPGYFRFPDQFFVPVMHGDRLDGVMVLTLTVEMEASVSEAVYAREFRLRDAFLRALLIHANTGGFDGNYTTEPRMRRLRRDLLSTARQVTEGRITDVLIGDIVRQESG